MYDSWSRQRGMQGTWYQGNSGNGIVQGMTNMQGKWVKINRGGPDSLNGQLETVNNSYMVLNTKDGKTFVAADHVKSVNELSDQSAANRSGGNKTAGNRTRGSRNGGYYSNGSGSYPSTFSGVVHSFNQKFVQINSGGPEMVTGFVAGTDAYNVKLVNNREVMLIPISHIRSIKAESFSKNKSSGNKDKSGGNNKKS